MRTRSVRSPKNWATCCGTSPPSPETWAYRLDDIAQINLIKIASRNEHNKIHGHGDNR